VKIGKLEVYRRFIITVSGDLVCNLEPLPETRQFGRLYSVDAKEYIAAAFVWPNEAEPLLRVEPLHGTYGHVMRSLGTSGQ
jgi:hypothetical protein